MMGAPFRLVLAAVFVACGSLGIFAVQRNFLRRRAVQPLPEDIHQLPLRLDKWQGEEQKLDQDTFVHVGADVVVDRAYHDDAEHEVRMHVAVFGSKPDDGVHHAPTNCYPSSGWTAPRTVQGSRAGSRPQRPNGGPVRPGNEEGETVHVVYWYRMGDYTLFERLDMGKVRWAMRGQATWPPLIKVLLETSATDKYAARVRILEIAALIQTWLEKAETRAVEGEGGATMKQPLRRRPPAGDRGTTAADSPAPP